MYLHKDIINFKTVERILHDYRFLLKLTDINTIKTPL